MRINQPEHLKPFYAESVRRNTRLGVRGFLIAGLFPSALPLISLALQASDGEPISLWRWLGAVGMGPLCVVLVKAALWFDATGNRFAEIRGDWVRVGPHGHWFRKSQMIFCKIDRNNHFPEIHRLCFCFRLFPFARPRYWMMMVEDLSAVKKFQRELAEWSI